MNRSMASPNSRQRLDALLALPLGQYRRRLTQLTPDELAALETRIALQEVKQRWARCSHGLERHRAVGELARLARRQAAARNIFEFMEVQNRALGYRIGKPYGEAFYTKEIAEVADPMKLSVKSI